MRHQSAAKFAIKLFFDYSRRQFSELVFRGPPGRSRSIPGTREPSPVSMRIGIKLPFILAMLLIALPGLLADCAAQSRPFLARSAYSALSAGLGTLSVAPAHGYFTNTGCVETL